jgi:hypothetical protein
LPSELDSPLPIIILSDSKKIPVSVKRTFNYFTATS